MMQSRRVGVVVGVALFVLLAALTPAAYAGRSLGPSPAPARSVAVAPAAPITLYLPIVMSPGATARFWAEQYTLAAGACTTLHWKTTLAKSVTLDTEAVAATGTVQACPVGTQYYTLQVTDNAGRVTDYDVTLTAGDPGLQAGEVVAQGVVQSVTPTADADPTQTGAQPGYQIQINSVKPLYTHQAGWNPGTVTLNVTQTWVDSAPVGGPIDWPVKAGQSVEFRATCDGSVCTMSQQSPNPYLYLRSE